MSSIEVEKGMYHNKFVLHHYAGKGDGFLWKMMGQSPHRLTGLDFLPQDTALAIFSDMDLPLLWSVAIAVAIRALGIPLPPFVLSALHLLGDATSGIMLLVLGMAIKPAALIGALRRIGTWWPMLPIELGLSPLVVAFAGVAIGLSGLNHRATILEAAIPPQLFVFIVADRFGFDTEVLATAVAFLTVISFLTLPVLHDFLG